MAEKVRCFKNEKYDLKYEIKESEGQKFISICGIEYNDDFDTLTVPEKIDGLPVKEIGEFAFSQCPFKNAILPDGLEIIHDDAFEECKKLEKVNFPDSLTFIGHCSFQKTQLNSVKFGKGLKSIDYGAFAGCESLKEITFEEGLEFIGEYAFEKNYSLKTVRLPDSLITLGYCAFDYCSALESIYLGENLAEINFSEEGEINKYSDFLYGCKKLEKIEVSPQNKFFKAIDGILYDTKEKILIKIPTAINRNVISIPKWVEEILPHCLTDKNLKKIIIKSPAIGGLYSSGINAKTVGVISCIPDSDVESFANKSCINVIPLSTTISDFLDSVIDTNKEH